MANGAFKFKDNYGNVVSFISGSGSNIIISGGTLDLSGMTGLTMGNITMSGTTQNATSASHAASYLLTSSFNSYSGTTDTIIGSLQTTTGSLNSFTSSATNRLNSIEGVTGSYATTGSNTFNGNLTVNGYVDVQELRTTFISSSILYRSGSTKFGDELTDTHSFTGSLSVSGSISSTSTITGTNFVTNGTTLYGVTLKGRSADNYGAIGFYSNDGLTRYGYVQSHSTNSGQLNITSDGGGQVIMDNRGVVVTSALSGSTATFGGIITVNSQTTAANGSINIESLDPAVRFRVTSGTLNNRIYEWRAAAAGGTNDFIELRLWNDAQNSATTLLRVSSAGAGVFSSSVTATGGYEIPNGQFYRARRTSSNLLTDMIGIPSGTDDVRIVTTGAFNVINGATNSMFYVKDNGYVGINTISPSTNLEIYRLETINRTTTTDILTINASANNAPYAGHGAAILFKGTTYNSGGSGVQGLRNWGRIGMYLNDSSLSTNGESMYFAVAPADNSDTVNTAMTIRYDGNVAVGTTSAPAKLTVQSVGATGILLEQDINNSAVSSRLVARNSTVTGTIRYDTGGWRFNTNATLDATSGTERALISTDGYFRMLSGTGGIQFQGNTSSANALNNYEEGTWTPILNAGSGNFTMSGINGGRYTRIGNQVTVTGQLQWSSGSGSGMVSINGLPFTSGGSIRTAGSIGAVGSGISFNSGYGQWLLVNDPTTSFIYIIQLETDGSGYSHTPIVASSGVIYGFSLTYFI